MTGLSVKAEFRRGNFELNVDVRIPRRGVTAILGPSGSGKSTLLRLIAGLEQPHRGRFCMGSSIWVDTAQKIFMRPQRRRVGIVFQDYALFPHLTVIQNIAYGVAKLEKEWSVRHWINKLGLEGLEKHYPHELSGGQKQRVALARALAPHPAMLLLDEPFSAVDGPLRQEMRNHLSDLVHHLQQPVVMITHDLEDVRHLADHVAVMIDGNIHQFDAVQHVFEQPATKDVALVLGWRNVLPAATLRQYLSLENSKNDANGVIAYHKDYFLAIRPEHIRPAVEQANGIPVVVTNVIELGAMRELRCALPDGTPLIWQRAWNEPVPVPGTHMRLQLPAQYLRVLKQDGADKSGHRVQAKQLLQGR